MKNTDLHGIIPAAITPFVDDRVSFDKFKYNLDRWNQTAITGYLILGSTGEIVLLNPDERTTVMKKIRSMIPPDKKLIIGVNCETTRDAISYVTLSRETGADVALVSIPSYFKRQMTDHAIFQFYADVAQQTQGFPILLYNIPQSTGITIPLAVVKALAETFPNIIGLKESSGNAEYILELVAGIPNDFQILVGSADRLASFLEAGAVGAILAVANMFFELCLAIYQCQIDRDIIASEKLQKILTEISERFTSLGVPAVKFALDQMDYFGGLPRKPLLELEEKQKQDIIQVIETYRSIQNQMKTKSTLSYQGV